MWAKKNRSNPRSGVRALALVKDVSIFVRRNQGNRVEHAASGPELNLTRICVERLGHMWGRGPLARVPQNAFQHAHRNTRAVKRVPLTMLCKIKQKALVGRSAADT